MAGSIKMRQHVERQIAKALIKDALAAGYSININNGGDTNELPKPSRDAKKILAAMFATDDEHLLVYERRPDPSHSTDRDMDEWVKVGWVWLVYGNSGWDVISDYTTSLEYVMAGADKESKKWQ